jgi:hypothetical protein
MDDPSFKFSFWRDQPRLDKGLSSKENRDSREQSPYLYSRKSRTLWYLDILGCINPLRQWSDDAAASVIIA